MDYRLKNRLLILLGAVILLLFTQDRMGMAFLILAMFLLRRMVKPGTVAKEYWRFLLGPLFFGIFRVLQFVLAERGGPPGTFLSFLCMATGLWLLACGIAWPLLSIVRLYGHSSARIQRRTILPVAAVLILGMVNADSLYILIASIWLVLWGLSWDWLDKLGRAPVLKKILLVLLTPLAVIFLARALQSGGGQESDVSLDFAAGQEGVLPAIRMFLTLFWCSVPLHLVSRAIKGMVLGFSIRLRLALTYMFSTVMPACFAVLLVGVAVFAGIGSLKARAARELIQVDLEGLEGAIRDHQAFLFSNQDSVGSGLYLRMMSGEDGGTGLAEFIRGAFPSDESLESLMWYGNLDDASERRIRSILKDQVLDMDPANELWLKVFERSSWVMPDTLIPLETWRSGESRMKGILPVGDGRAAMTAALYAERLPTLVRVMQRPFNSATLERYKRIIGSDLVVHPTQPLTLTNGTAVTPDAEGEGDSTGDSVDESIMPSMRADQISTVRETRTGFFHTPLHHGICELHDTWQLTNASRVVRGFLVVRTSIADLVSSLYSTRGMNIVPVIVVAALALLLFTAVLLSTILGFSLLGSITTAISALKQGAERLRQGDLDVRIELESRDELNRLAAGFNDMASDLKRMVQQVAEKERLDREIQIARQIQINLLPSDLPQVEGYEIAGDSLPAYEVGGDYYDVIRTAPDRLVLVVADVSGKGVAAAMLMSNLQAALHVLLRQNITLDSVAVRLNQMVFQSSTPEMFITCFLAVIDTSLGVIEYVNAGHDHPLVVRGAEVIELQSCGFMLGIFPDASYDLRELTLEPGDNLALYSDGITDAFNAQDEEFGKDRLVEALQSLSSSSAHLILEGVFQRVKDHVGTHDAQIDDLTFLVLRIMFTRKAGSPGMRYE